MGISVTRSTSIPARPRAASSSAADYERIVSMRVPAMVVIGSEDPVRPSWQVISRALADVPEQVTIVLFQGAAHAINLTHPRELSHAIRQYVAGKEVRMDLANPSCVPVLRLQRPV